MIWYDMICISWVNLSMASQTFQMYVRFLSTTMTTLMSISIISYNYCIMRSQSIIFNICKKLIETNTRIMIFIVLFTWKDLTFIYWFSWTTSYVLGKKVLIFVKRVKYILFIFMLSIIRLMTSLMMSFISYELL